GISIALGLIVTSTSYYVWRQRENKLNEELLNERGKVLSLFDGQAAIVSQSIVNGEKALALGKDRDALRAANDAVAAGEQVEAALALPKLELNKTWADKLRADRGAEARRVHA